jgi:hypothetical protein
MVVVEGSSVNDGILLWATASEGSEESRESVTSDMR